VNPLTNFPRDLGDYPDGGLSAQEAHMRRALSILAIAALVSVVVDVVIAPSKTVVNMAATKGQFHNSISIYGLHVALPETMKSFPVELVPLP
jgi:hypothetical protein